MPDVTIQQMFARALLDPAVEVHSIADTVTGGRVVKKQPGVTRHDFTCHSHFTLKQMALGELVGATILMTAEKWRAVKAELEAEQQQTEHP